MQLTSTEALSCLMQILASQINVAGVVNRLIEAAGGTLVTTRLSRDLQVGHSFYILFLFIHHTMVYFDRRGECQWKTHKLECWWVGFLSRGLSIQGVHGLDNQIPNRGLEFYCRFTAFYSCASQLIGNCVHELGKLIALSGALYMALAYASQQKIKKKV